MCIFNALGVLFYEPLEGLSPAASFALYGMLYSLLALISFVVIWFFWRGRNWARLLVMATSVLAVTNLSWFWPTSSVAKVILVAEAILGAWLLFWLNTRPAKAFFRRGAEGHQPSVAG
jgi:hypothetical protein